MNLGSRIHGWKEIATYIGRTERTARRWEVERQLPVRRTPGDGRSSVYAIVSELDSWLLSMPLAQAEAGEVHNFADRPSAVVAPLPYRMTSSPRSSWLIASMVAALLLPVALTAFAVRRLNTPHSRASTLPASSRASKVPGVDALYVQGLYQYEKHTPGSLKTALGLFAEATTRDPKYAPGWAKLANTYTVLGEYETINTLDAYARARDADERALALDPSLAEPHANLGFMEFFRVGDAHLADLEFQTALTLEPGNAMVHSWFGTVLTFQGRTSEGVAEFNKALQLDPNSPSIQAGRALAIGLSGHRDEGLALLEKLDHDSPSPLIAHHMTVLAAMEPRRVDLYLRGKEEIANAENLNPSNFAMYEGAQKQYAAGHGSEAAAWRFLAQGRTTDPLLRAEANSALGRKDASFAILNQLVRQPGPSRGIKADPFLAPLHDDPRWPRLIRQDGRSWSPQ